MPLNHKILGEGEPIIVMHGLFGMLDNWQTVAKQLAKDYMLILLDLRNHGKSFHSDEWSVELMADDVKAFMEENWIHNATIVGHSMGGKVAMELALSEGDLVKKLVVVDIGPKAYQPGHQKIFEALHSVDIDKVKSREEANEMLSKKIEDIGIVHFLLKNIARKKEGGYRWKMNLDSITRNYETIIQASRMDEEYDGETLFIRGSLSNYILDEDFEDIRLTFPNSKIETVEGAGHWVHADKKEDLIELLRNFIG